MKPYGNTKAQNSMCEWGCCTFGTIKTGHRPIVKKQFISAARKRARQLDKRIIKNEMNEL